MANINTHSGARLIGIAMMAMAMVLVGSTVVVSAIIGDGMTPFQGTALRFAIASVGFAILWVIRGERLPKLSGRDWGILILQAAAGSFAYSVLLIFGMTFVSGATAGVVVGSLPAVMALLTVIVLRERIGKAASVAVIIATLAVLIVTLSGQGESSVLPGETFDWWMIAGVIIILLAVACEASFLLLNRALKTPVPPFQVASLMCAFGFAMSCVAAFVEWLVVMPPPPSAEAIWGAVYYAIMPTLMGFPLWYGGSIRGTSSDAALATAIMPIAALILSVVVLGETVSALQILACGMVVVAIIIGTLGEKKH